MWGGIVQVVSEKGERENERVIEEENSRDRDGLRKQYFLNSKRIIAFYLTVSAYVTLQEYLTLQATL